MSDYCGFCDTRRPEGGTNMLVLNGGDTWLEFCESCGNSEWLNNALTGEWITVGNLFRGEDGYVEPTNEHPKAVADDVVEAPVVRKSNQPTLADIWPKELQS